MRRRWLGQLASTVAATALGACATPSPHPEAATPTQVAPFSTAPANGALPPLWLPYVLRRDQPRTEYGVVRKDGRTVLQAGGKGGVSGLKCACSIDPRATPLLRWQWRVDSLPPGMSVTDSDTDDSPARIVVAFEGDESTLPARDRGFFELVHLVTGQRLPFATLMYVWDGSAPVGTVAAYERTSRIQYVVAESGPARTGQWLSYERNVVADFERVYGEPPPGRITSVGVLTDSDDLKLDLQAWYGDLGLFA